MRLKIFLLTTIIVSVFETGLCQSSFKWGIHFGITSSNQTNYIKSKDATREYGLRTGIIGGIFAEFFDYQYFSFVTDLSYKQKGTQDKNISVIRQAYNEQGYEEIGYLDQRFDYLSLRTIAKFKFSLYYFTPYFILGPDFSYLLGGNSQAKILTDDYNKFQLGYSVGIGTELKTALPFSIILEASYDQDITRAYDGKILYIKNHSYEFRFGALF